MNAQWTFNQTVTPPPVSGGLRFNATTTAATTLVYISETDRDGLNRTAGLDAMAVGDQLMVQSQQGRAVFNITSIVDSGTYRTLGVTVAESTGTRPSASAITTVYSVTTGVAVHGIPAGGTAGQVLTKTSSTDYAAGWEPILDTAFDSSATGYISARNVFPTRLWITTDATDPAGSVDGDYRIRPAP